MDKDNFLLSDEAPDFQEELKMACWNVLHDNPGCDCQDWINILIEQYPTEVIDEIGPDPEEVFSRLTDWWDCMDYEDTATGMCERFRDWAEYFATDKSVELYDMLRIHVQSIN